MQELVVLACAENQLLSHYAHLHSHGEHLAAAFDLEVQEHIDLLCQFPELGARCRENIRRLVLKRWNMGVYYVIQGRRVIVIAVMDLRQDPAVAQ